MHSTKRITRRSRFNFRHAVGLIGLLIGLLVSSYAPLPSVAQHNTSWANPFDASSAQGTNAPASYNAWDAPRTASTTEGYDADDPWGTENAWSTDHHRDESFSDGNWSSDFYESSPGDHSRPAGNSPTTHSASCGSPGNPNNKACVKACSRSNPPPTCNLACNTDPGGEACEAFQDSCRENPNTAACQRFGSQGTGNPANAPIPGLVYLLLGGLGYGGYKLRNTQTA